MAKSKTDQVFAKVFAIAEAHPVPGIYLARLSVALAELPNRDRVVRRVLTEMVEHDNPSRRRIGIHACRRIGRFDAPGLRAALLGHLADRDPWVRYDAAWAIKEARYDGQDVREALGKLAGGARLPRDRQRSDADPDNAALAARVEARETLDALVTVGGASEDEQVAAAILDLSAVGGRDASMAKVPAHLARMFDEDEAAECPPLTAAKVRRAEKKLGYRLPAAYVELLMVCNGGNVRRNFFPTTKCPRWADDHVAFDTVLGIGGDWGIDSETGSAYLIAEWEYPAVGVVISSDGHTAFMLDYRKCGPEGEPRVAWVDVETGTGKPNLVVLAPDFVSFVRKLRVTPEDDDA